MDSTLKQRLIGAAVLAALAIIFLPMLLKGPDVRDPDAAAVPLTMPPTPGQEYETRELPLTEPAGASGPGGVLGMERGPGPAPANDNGLPVPDQQASVPAEPPPAVEPAAPPAPATASPVAAVAAGNHVVNIGTFSNLSNATAVADKLRAARLPVAADRVTLASGPAMRLRVGPYADRAAAEAARLRAESITGSTAKVIVLDAAEPRPAAAVAAPAKPATPATAPVRPSASPAPAPAPASTPPAAPDAVSAGFAVQLSAPSVEAEAIALRDRARAQGFNSFVQRVDTDSGVRYRVRVGPVTDRTAAAALRESVNGKLGTKGIVVPNP